MSNFSVGGVLSAAAFNLFAGFEIGSLGLWRFLFGAGFTISDFELAGSEAVGFEA